LILAYNFVLREFGAQSKEDTFMAESTTEGQSVISTPCGGGAPGPDGQQSGGSMMGMLFPLAIFVLIFYFFILRPQKKRQKQQESLISSVGRGDQIVTIGGFFATVKDVKDDGFIVELSDGVKAKILKSAVSSKLSGGAAPAPTTMLSKESSDS
jgi:preprotein translocase subunit YajC